MQRLPSISVANQMLSYWVLRPQLWPMHLDVMCAHSCSLCEQHR